MDNIERLERRHFALPAAFVLTLLAFLFFGTARPPVLVPQVAVPAKTPPAQGPEIEVKPYELPPPDVPDGPERLRTSIDEGGGQVRPTIPDEPRPVGPKDFVVPVEPQRLQPTGPTDKIGDVGQPPSDDGKIGPGRGRVPSWKELDQPPRTRAQVSPIYPAKEKYEGINGSVEVEFIVDETGAVVNPRVVGSSLRAFEEPTLRAVEQWRFVPGRSRGKVVSFRMRVPVLFNVND